MDKLTKLIQQLIAIINDTIANYEISSKLKKDLEDNIIYLNGIYHTVKILDKGDINALVSHVNIIADDLKEKIYVENNRK